jgi:hypothetical protein
MRLLIFNLFLFLLLSSTANATNLRRAFEVDAKPVFARYCAGCHASAGAPDYTEFSTAAMDRGVIYNRVFVTGDMPWRLRVSLSDKAKLRSWLLMEGR